MDLFKRVAIPVAEDIDIEYSLRRLFELKEHNDVLHIHFIYFTDAHNNILLKLFSRLFYTSKKSIFFAEEEASYYAQKIKTEKNYCITVTAKLGEANITKSFIKYFQESTIDTLIYCRRKKALSSEITRKTNFNKLAKKTKCAILGINPGAVDQTIKNILLPVNNELSNKNIQAAIYMAHKNKSNIHLITFLDYGKEDHCKRKIDTFYQTYKLLKECGFSPHYRIISKNDTQENLLHYAEQMHSNLILLNPKKEAFLNRLIYKNIFSYIHPLSSIQFLLIKNNFKTI